LTGDPQPVQKFERFAFSDVFCLLTGVEKDLSRAVIVNISRFPLEVDDSAEADTYCGLNEFGWDSFNELSLLTTGTEEAVDRFPLEVDDSAEVDTYCGLNDFGWDSFNELSLLTTGIGEIVEGVDGEDAGLLLLLLEDVEEAVELSVELLETERPVAIPTLACVERLDVFNPERFEEGDKMLSDDDEETESIFAFEGDSFETTDRILVLVLEDAAGDEVTTVPTEAVAVEDFFEADNDATGDGEE